MSRFTLIAAIILVLGLGGVGVYALMNTNSGKDDTAMMEDITMMEDSMEKDTLMPEPVMVKDKNDAMMDGTMEKDSMEKDAMDGDAMLLQKGGQYVTYTPAALADAATGRRVLFFYANWCPTCQPADADFQQNEAQLPADVSVIRVNYNDNATDAQEEALAKQYGVTYQHTYVQIDENGQAIKKWNGGAMEELLENLAE